MTRPRDASIDLLRGLAVVLMIFTHVHDAWLLPGARHGAWFAAAAFLFALPSRLFLVLTGAALALRLEAQAVRGTARRTMLVGALRRGLELVGLGLALRAHDFLVHGFEPARLLKVDILNTLGAATCVLALTCMRADGRPAGRRALAVAALAVVGGAALGGRAWPDGVPAPLGAYLFGPRPLAWFPLLPWLAYAAVGVAAGVALTAGRAVPGRPGPTALVGLALLGAGAGLQAVGIGPARWAAAEAHPGLLCLSTGGVVLLWSVVLEAAPHVPGLVRAPLLALGQASLPVYLVHLGLVYGRASAPLHGRLGLPGAALATLALSAAMLPLAWLWQRRPWHRARPALSGPPASAA